MGAQQPALIHTGRAILAFGALLLIASIFVDYFAETADSFAINQWHLSKALGGTVLALSAIALTLALLGYIVRTVVLVILATIIGAVALGIDLYLPIGLAFKSWDEFSVGPYLGIGGGTLCVVGGLLATIGALFSSSVASTAGPVKAPLPAQSLPGPGWYPDPSGTARERLWSGERWTAETR